MAALSFSEEISIDITYWSKFINRTDAVTTEILQLWIEISYKANVNSTDHFLSLPLSHNSLIRIDNRPVYYKSWSCKGIQNVTDLLKGHNTLLSSYELGQRYNVKTNFLVLHGLKSSLKSMRESRSLSTTSSQSFLRNFLKAKKRTKVVYERLVIVKQKTFFKARKNGSLILNAKVMKPLTGSRFTYSRLNARKLLN